MWVSLGLVPGSALFHWDSSSSFVALEPICRLAILKCTFLSSGKILSSRLIFANCLCSIFPWVSNRHLKRNMSKAKLLISPCQMAPLQPFPSFWPKPKSCHPWIFPFLPSTFNLSQHILNHSLFSTKISLLSHFPAYVFHMELRVIT